MKNKLYIVLILVILVAICTGVYFAVESREAGQDDVTVLLQEEKSVVKVFDLPPDDIRQKHIESILAGVVSYIEVEGQSLDDFGEIPTCNVKRTIIGKKGLNLEIFLTPTYLKNIPSDPIFGEKLDTGYTICVNNNGKINITAPHSERGKMQVLNID